MAMKKLITAKEAAGIITDGSTVAIGGFGAYCAPDCLLQAIADEYRDTGHPANLMSVTGISPGSNVKGNIRGLSRVAVPGLFTSAVAGHFANCPEFSELVANEQTAGFLLPLGVVIALVKAIAAGRPGVITDIGLGTYADPRQEACYANETARKSGRKVVELIRLQDKEYLFYPSFKIDYAIIRGSYADEDGNISIEREALTYAGLSMAAAARNSGGKVIVQVEKTVKNGTLHPRNVHIHSSFVDYVVTAEPEMHMQSYAAGYYRPELTGEIRIPADNIEPMPLNVRKVIARRAAMELKPGNVINLGIGIPSGVGNVANEEGFADKLIMSLESGPIGGIPVEGVGFAAAVNPDAIMSTPDTLDFYDGGFLDVTCLGAAEIDREGNVNVSKFGSRMTGPGGFIDISQNTKNVIFTGTFTAGKADMAIGDGKLNIVVDGEKSKFVEKVQQITFSSKYAKEHGQKVIYITERAVFVLRDNGVELVEIAPGADLEKDILSKMEFTPLISGQLKTMDERIFKQGKMGLC